MVSSRATEIWNVAIANSIVPIMPELYKLGDFALQSLKAKLTQNPPPTVPLKTFKDPLASSRDHVFISLSSIDPKISFEAQESGQTRIAQFRAGH